MAGARGETALLAVVLSTAPVPTPPGPTSRASVKIDDHPSAPGLAGTCQWLLHITLVVIERRAAVTGRTWREREIVKGRGHHLPLPRSSRTAERDDQSVMSTHTGR